MIKKLHISMVSILMIGLMFACSTSNDVASNRGIQKRKYNKGFYVEKGPKLGGETKNVDQVDNENTFEENTMAIEEPAERLSSTPEVVLVEDESVIGINEVTENEVIQQSTKNSDAVSNLEIVVPEKTRVREKLKKGVEKVFHKIKNPSAQDMTRGSSSSGLVLILLVILAIFLPPLAVVIYDGVGRPFWIDLVLWLIAIGVGYALFGAGIAFLCGLIATIYALLIIFDVV